MRKVPTWVALVCVFAFCSLIATPVLGIVFTVLIFIYLQNHGYFDSKEIQKPNHIPRSNVKPDIPRKSRKANGNPPEFIRKIEFLSSREIVFSNFSSARYLEENGSHQMVDVKHPKNAKIYIRLNKDQFDVFIDCDQKREQLSFEKCNLKILDITNHNIAMIEGNKGESYLKINYDNQYFTTLEVEALMDFFQEFSIHNKTTKFQEQSYVKDVPPIAKKAPKQKVQSKRLIPALVTSIVCVCLLVGGILAYSNRKVTQEFYNLSAIEGRTNTKYINSLAYEINNEIVEESWGSEAHYKFSNRNIPELIIMNELTDTDYTQVYTYDKTTFEALEEELDFYYYRWYAQKKQYDFVNVESGKWYHFSGILAKKDYYNNDSKQDLYVDIYVMPTTKSLVQVTLVRSVDDMCDYDVTEFISRFDFSELMTYYV